MLLVAAFIAACLLRVGAQTPAQADINGRAFEVASIKPNTSGDGRFAAGTERGGRFVATNVTARRVVLSAYGLEDYQLMNGPGWFTSEHFDIVAKAAGEIPDDWLRQQSGPSVLQQLLRNLLASRFRLAVHVESRELPTYVLTTVRADGRPGPMLVPASGDCAGSASRGQQNTPAPCSMNYSPGHVSAGAVSVAAFAGRLAQVVGRPVLDRTGLKGTYDIDVSWTPDQASVDADAPPDRPSIFTAVREQLGLKLESARGPVDVLVIDHVERPTPD
jgi:uncharacterized protein (TIGR03435 family)